VTVRRSSGTVHPAALLCLQRVSGKFFVNDRENPTRSIPTSVSLDSRPQVGGKSSCGPAGVRLERPRLRGERPRGFGVDWPIRYADIAPWYDYVESSSEFGEALGCPSSPDGSSSADVAELRRSRWSGRVAKGSRAERIVQIGRVAILHHGSTAAARRALCGPATWCITIRLQQHRRHPSGGPRHGALTLRRQRRAQSDRQAIVTIRSDANRLATPSRTTCSAQFSDIAGELPVRELGQAERFARDSDETAPRNRTTARCRRSGWQSTPNPSRAFASKSSRSSGTPAGPHDDLPPTGGANPVKRLVGIERVGVLAVVHEELAAYSLQA